MKRVSTGLVLSMCLYVAVPAWAADGEDYTINIKDHKFEPAQLYVPARKKVKVVVHNQDPTPEEFESFDLDREQEVDGGKQINVYIGPLAPGTYGFFGDYNQKTAQGNIVVQK